MDIFKYENWPYFFVIIIIILLIVNVWNCKKEGGYVTLRGKEWAEHKTKKTIIPAKPISDVATHTALNVSTESGKAAIKIACDSAKQISEQVASETARQVSEQVAGQVASQVAEQVAGHVSGQVASEAANQISGQANQNAANIAAQIATQATTNVLTETFKAGPTPVKSYIKIPGAFSKPVEKFAPYEAKRTVKGVDIGAMGQQPCNCEDPNCDCNGCNKNLNDQINLGVNNYIFPNCNNDYMCLNGCNIQDQINNYSFDYHIGHTCTELDRSHSGAYASLNVESCSEDCPSMKWLPPAEQTRLAAGEYIANLQPVENFYLKKN